MNELVEACKRLKMFTFCNWTEKKVYFVYTGDETLTIDQEVSIMRMIEKHLPGCEVIFGKCKKEKEE